MDPNDLQITHDADWDQLPEVAQAIKEAGGEENCYAAVTSALFRGHMRSFRGLLLRSLPYPRTFLAQALHCKSEFRAYGQWVWLVAGSFGSTGLSFQAE